MVLHGVVTRRRQGCGLILSRALVPAFVVTLVTALILPGGCLQPQGTAYQGAEEGGIYAQVKELNSSIQSLQGEYETLAAILNETVSENKQLKAENEELMANLTNAEEGNEHLRSKLIADLNRTLYGPGDWIPASFVNAGQGRAVIHGVDEVTYLSCCGSMRPVIPDKNATVLLKRFKAEDASKLISGDIIAVDPYASAFEGIRQEGFSLMIHRVREVRVDEQGRLMFLTMGDANGFLDGWVYPRDIRFIVVAVVY